MKSTHCPEFLNCVSKTVPTLSNLKWFSKFFALLERIWNLLQNPYYDIAHLALGMLLQYLGKLKIQISAYIQPIWKKMQAYCILIASDFVTRPQMLIFSVLKNGVSFPILIAKKIFSCHCSFGYLLVRLICGAENSSQQTSLQCLSTINMVFTDEDKIIIKSLYLKGYTAKRLTDEFPEKRWTKCGVNKLLKTFRDTGTVDRRPDWPVIWTSKLRWIMLYGFCSKFHTLSSNAKSVQIG